MDRLTKNFNGAFGLVKVKDNEQEIESPYRNTLQACFESGQRLGQYEDTGLTPGEIAALRAELDALKSDIEAGRMVRLPAAVGQMVYVPSGDGGVYGAYVKDIGVLRPDAHDAIMRATVRVGLESKTLEYMIALENKETHWFDTEEAARAALEGGNAMNPQNPRVLAWMAATGETTLDGAGYKYVIYRRNDAGRRWIQVRHLD